MFKLRLLALLALSAAPAVLRSEPITYRLSFKATGTYTPYATGAPLPINGDFFLTMRNDTSDVQILTDGDGDPIGYQTTVKDVAILVPGVVDAASTPILFMSPDGGPEEIFQEQINPLSLTLVFSLASGDYNLTSGLETSAGVTVNYFNMGILVTSKGIIALNPETVNGIFTGKLKSGGSD